MTNSLRFAGCLAFTCILCLIPYNNSVHAVDLKPGDIFADLVVVDPVTGDQTMAGIELRGHDNLAFDNDGNLLNIYGGGITTHDLDTNDQWTIFPNDVPSSILGLVVAGDGRIFAYDAGSVSRIDPDTGLQSILSSGAHFDEINSIAMDTNGDVLIGDRGNKTLFAIDPDSGVRQTISSGGSIFDMAGIAVDGNGDYIVLNDRATAPFRFVKIDRDTKVQSNAVNGDLENDQGLNINTSLSTLADFVIDSNGDFLVVMQSPLGQNAGVFRIDPSTGLTTNINDERFVTSDMVKNSNGDVFFTANILDGIGLYQLDTQTGEAEIIIYQGIFASATHQAPAAADTDVVYYILNGIKRLIPTNGKIEDVASGGLLTQPADLEVESDGNLLVLDNANDRIIRVNPESGAQSLVGTLDVDFGVVDISLGYDGFLYVLRAGFISSDLPIIKLDPSNGTTSLVPFNGIGLNNLDALAVEPNGDILIVSGPRIARLSATTGDYVFIAHRDDPGSLIDRPRDLAVGVNGEIYVADSDSRALIVIDPVTLQQSILSDGGYMPTSGVIRRPVELALVPGAEVVVPNEPPQATILGGNQTIIDSDNFAGEPVNLTATATDNDGTIESTQWLINDIVVANGLVLDIPFPDGQTEVTFEAVDDDGASSSDTVTINVEAPPLSPGWPVPYSGVTPHESLGLEFNNISALNTQDGLIYSCLRVLSNGLQSMFNGVEMYDIAFEILSLSQGTIQVARAKPFNETGALNENGELPDCSGSIELTTNIYTDIIQAGNQIYSVTFELIDGDNLILRGLDLSVIATLP